MKFGQIKKPLLYKKNISVERTSGENIQKKYIDIKWNLNEMLLVKIAVISLNES